MHRLTPSVRYVLMLWLIALCGCGGCSGCGISATSPQGQRLKALMAEKIEIVPKAPDDVPITFKAITIESKGEGANERLYPALPWELTTDQKALRKVLGDQARARRRDLLSGQVTQYVLFLYYKGKEGEDCGEETLSFPVSDLSSKVTLKKLCEKDGPLPRSATTALESVTWQENDVTVPFRKGQSKVTKTEDMQKRIRPVMPANLPILFGEVTLDPKDPNFKEPPLLNWNLTERNNTTFPTLLKAATEKAPDVSPLTDVKSVTCIFTYKDQQGQPLATDQIVLQVSDKQGSVSLTHLNKPAELARIVIEPVSATWQGRSVNVPIR